MIPFLSLVGHSGSGKTTLLEKLIPELTRRGHRVATVKHHAGTFEIDQPGKDTWRHRQAGAVLTIISSPGRLGLVQELPGPLPLAELRERYIREADLIITEGFKQEAYPKIEVFRRAVSPAPLCTRRNNLVAMVSDDAPETEVPVFSFLDLDGLAGFIESRYCRGRRRPGVKLLANGQRVPLNPFVARLLESTIRGMALALKDVDAGGELVISLPATASQTCSGPAEDR